MTEKGAIDRVNDYIYHYYGGMPAAVRLFLGHGDGVLLGQCHAAENAGRKGNSRAALACRLLERYDKLLSTILIGNNIVNIAMASLATALFVKSFGDAGATLSTIVVTVVVLIFGEISPKSIAKDCAENWAMTAAPFLRCLIWLLMPLNALFSLWKSCWPGCSIWMGTTKCPRRSC